MARARVIRPFRRRSRSAVGARGLGRVAGKGRFANGVVVVKPSGSATVTVPLGGQYVQPNGTAVTSLLLGPHSGAVLRKP